MSERSPVSFWSKLVAEGLLGKEVQTKFYITDLVDEFLSLPTYDFKEFVNAAPPFPEFWMEGKHKGEHHGFLIYSWRVKKDIPTKLLLANLISTFNVIYKTTKEEQKTQENAIVARDILRAITWATVNHPSKLLEAVRLLQDDENYNVDLPKMLSEPEFEHEWVLGMTLFVGGKHSDPFEAANVVFMLDENGMTPYGKKFAITLSQQPKDPENLAEVVESTVAMACYAMSLMNCKNISFADIATTPSKRYRKKNREKKIIFKVLMIDPMGKKAKKKPSGEAGPKQEKFKRLHMCRGHMADYRKGNGLFGKYKGVFFVPAHVRGTPRDGMVIKDYEFI